MRHDGDAAVGSRITFDNNHSQKIGGFCPSVEVPLQVIDRGDVRGRCPRIGRRRASHGDGVSSSASSRSAFLGKVEEEEGVAQSGSPGNGSNGCPSDAMGNKTGGGRQPRIASLAGVRPPPVSSRVAIGISPNIRANLPYIRRFFGKGSAEFVSKFARVRKISEISLKRFATSFATKKSRFLQKRSNRYWRKKYPLLMSWLLPLPELVLSLGVCFRVPPASLLSLPSLFASLAGEVLAAARRLALAVGHVEA